MIAARRLGIWRSALILAAALPLHPAPAATRTELQARREAFAKLGAVKSWSKRAWKNAYTHNTMNYSIRTNTSIQTAKYIGKLMELTAKRYREIFGYRFGPIPRLSINAYASAAEYGAIAQKYGLPPGTGGFYSAQGAGAIHLPYVESFGRHPSVTLFHEGAHQFVHEVIDFKLPLALRSKLPKQLHKLPTVPIWLNEGLATYMETARYDGQTLEIGRVNPGRLAQLQRMLRSRTNPSVREVVERRRGQPFAAAHYAVAWGIVYALRHHHRVPERDRNRRKLIKFIEACKRGFYHAPNMEFAKEFMAGGALPRDFVVRWNVRVGERSRVEFEKQIAGGPKKMESWEKEWTARILKLRPDLPYGGTNRGDAAWDKGKTGLH